MNVGPVELLFGLVPGIGGLSKSIIIIKLAVSLMSHPICKLSLFVNTRLPVHFGKYSSSVKLTLPN
jgi:hypothetical protein